MFPSPPIKHKFENSSNFGSLENNNPKNNTEKTWLSILKNKKDMKLCLHWPYMNNNNNIETYMC